MAIKPHVHVSSAMEFIVLTISKSAYGGMGMRRGL